jgi:hypothetical protein
MNVQGAENAEKIRKLCGERRKSGSPHKAGMTRCVYFLIGMTIFGFFRARVQTHRLDPEA